MDYYIRLAQTLLEDEREERILSGYRKSQAKKEAVRQAREINKPKGSLKSRCAAKANAEPDPRKRQGVYNACMRAGGDSGKSTKASEVMRRGSSFTKGGKYGN
tara:strand:- start:2698 stop:3006 length:309 start_codon:yes stop_codon:yes gene_type:complete